MSVVIPSLRAAIAVPPWVRNDLWRRARAVPSLDLRFADNKSLTDAVTGASLVTFTRSSNGTFVDSARVLRTAATDVPRFDHDPTTGESLGLLVEEQRTNLLLQSNAFTTAWSANSVTLTSAAAVSPSGITDAWLFSDIASTSNHNIAQSISWTAAATTFSVFAKYNTHRWLGVRIGVGGNQFFGSWDLLNGVVGSATAGATVGIQSAGSGWYRLTLTATLSTVGAANLIIGLNNSDAVALTSYLGTGTGSYLWGAQLEAGAFPTSYIPTTTAAVTRNADVASITGSAFSGWYSQSEGTVFVDYLRAYSGNFANFPNLYQFNDGTSNNEITLFGNQGAQTFSPLITTTSVAQLDFVATTSVFPGPNKSAHGFGLNNSTLAGNGVLTTPDTSVNLPTVNQVKFGERGGQRFTGHYKRICFWPTRLANSTLQGITQ